MNRTKEELGNTLKILLKDKGLDRITVTNIVEKCGVNRQTFYYHFDDINDLCKFTFKTELRQVIRDNRKYDNWQNGCLATMNYLKENESVVNNIMATVDRRKLDLSLKEGADYIMTKVVDEVSENMNVSDDDKQFIVRFYRTVFIGLITDWVDRGMKEKPQIIVDKLSIIIQGNIKIALDRFEQHV